MSICSNSQVPGFKSIIDLGRSTYLGFQGGHYPNGSARRPPAYEAEGVAIAEHIGPLDASGNRDTVAGKVVLAFLGPSWTNLVAPVFQSRIDEPDVAPLLNRNLVVANLAQRGKTIDELADPTDSYWTTWIPQQLAILGITAAQVQCAWIQCGRRNPPGGFPAHAIAEQAMWELAVANARATLPNLRMAWLTGPIYLGYADPPLPVPEPAYGEQMFAIKWAVERRINGLLPKLPFLSVGLDVWTNGVAGRSDGYIFKCPDHVLNDGLHPNNDGCIEISDRLLAFFMRDPCAAPWFGGVGARDGGSAPPPNQAAG